MTPYPVYAQSGPPEWWQILAALGPWILLLAGCVLGFVWWRTLGRETKPVSRPDFWSRIEWALEASVDANPKKRRAGRAALDLLNSEVVPGSDEAKIIAQAGQGIPGRQSGASTVNGKLEP